MRMTGYVGDNLRFKSSLLCLILSNPTCLIKKRETCFKIYLQNLMNCILVVQYIQTIILSRNEIVIYFKIILGKKRQYWEHNKHGQILNVLVQSQCVDRAKFKVNDLY